MIEDTSPSRRDATADTLGQPETGPLDACLSLCKPTQMEKRKPRQLIGLAKAERYQVSLPPEIAAKFKELGVGNMSAGIRLALQRMLQAQESGT